VSKRQNGREIDGLLILDKAIGLTSNKCLQQVKRLLGAAKAGHTGSLDPLASGVLPLCFGEATKISQFLLDSDKTYRARVRLGVSTTTGDSEGDALSSAPVPAFTQEQIELMLTRFEGVINQTAPVYSALKQDGVPLYKLARAGRPIEPKCREITIHHIVLLSWQHPDIELEVLCSKGTYIRTLAEDVGKALGTLAHLTALRRINAGPFSLKDSLTLAEMEALADSGALEGKLVPADSAINVLPAVTLNVQQTRLLRQGQNVELSGALACAHVRVYCGDEFIGVGAISAEGKLGARRLLKYDQAQLQTL
jgi:tRNA pseudouridine55 synthase